MDDRSQTKRPQTDSAPKKERLPYEPPRVVSDEAFEQISLACSTKMGTHKNFT